MSNATPGFARIADKITHGIACSSETDWNGLRDCIDTVTGGEYDALQLDILTDMVFQRRAALSKASAL
jgi:hypothetical protein